MFYASSTLILLEHTQVIYNKINRCYIYGCISGRFVGLIDLEQDVLRTGFKKRLPISFGAKFEKLHTRRGLSFISLCAKFNSD